MLELVLLDLVLVGSAQLSHPEEELLLPVFLGSLALPVADALAPQLPGPVARPGEAELQVELVHLPKLDHLEFE